MKKNNLSIFFLIHILWICISCTKKSGGVAPQIAPRDTYLIVNVWGLKSATSINSLSSGTMHNYKGTINDSLKFLWVLNPNLDITALDYSISGVNRQVDASYSSLSWAIVSGADTSTIAYDTVFIAAPWKPNYSDTLFITKVSGTTLVFNVRYADSGGIGVETDTLYRLRGVQ